VLSGAGAAADALDAIEAVVATARDQLAAVRAGEVAPLADGVGGLLGTLRERREARETTGRPVVGLSTGLGPRLDTALNGLCGGRTYVLGGEPGVGKTTVAWWVAQHAARQGACAVYLDAENGADALLLRALAAQAGVPFGDYERGYGDLDALEAAAAAMGDVLRRVYVLDARIAGITPQQLAARAAKARALCHADGLLVVVDYLQKLATDGPDRRIQVEAASAACRTIATTLQCPVLALSSLNRAAYATPGAERTPGQLMAGLRETGVLEYDADVVMRLVRAKQPNTLRIDVVKNRQGESGQGTLIVRQPATGRIAEGAMEE
jgi:replicative DNA helicase